MKLKFLKYQNEKVSMTDKMLMQAVHEQGLWAKALIAACPDKQWKLGRPTVKKYAAALMKGDRLWNVVKAAEGRNLSALQHMGYHIRGAMLEKHQTIFDQSQKRWEYWRLHWNWCGKIYLWNPSTKTSKLDKKPPNMGGYWWWIHWT